MTERTAMPDRYLSTPQPAFPGISTTPMQTDALLTILGYRRSARSDGEAAMIAQFIDPLAPDVDAYGNRFLTIANAEGDAPHVAFTAHTDTVHREIEGQMTDVVQALTTTHDGRMLGVERNQCLGADDGTGVWILLNLIKAGVPGLYCFFREEESGRLGSEWSAEHEPTRYAGIDMMLSFDRAGTSDIITHQMGERCCSEEFALRLAAQLDPYGEMAPDPTGSFTDSCSFTHLIPECTNVSVGYDAQHSRWETQDLSFCSWLVTRLLLVDWSDIPVAREPGREPDTNMLDLVETYPEAIAELLETFYGLTSDEIVGDLADFYGAEPEQIVHQALIEQALRREDSTHE